MTITIGANTGVVDFYVNNYICSDSVNLDVDYDFDNFMHAPPQMMSYDPSVCMVRRKVAFPGSPGNPDKIAEAEYFHYSGYIDSASETVSDFAEEFMHLRAEAVTGGEGGHDGDGILCRLQAQQDRSERVFQFRGNARLALDFGKGFSSDGSAHDRGITREFGDRDVGGLAQA